MKQNLVISCPATSRSGYGDHSRDLIRSLMSMDKFNIKIMDQRWGSCPRNALSPSDPISKLIMPKGPINYKPDVWIQVTVPNEFQPVGNYNIGITAGIETDRVAPSWVEGCNRMDMVIVPSLHSKHTLEQTAYHKKDKAGNSVGEIKLTTPVHILSEGLDINIFDKKEKSDFNLDAISEQFCFLQVGHWLQGAHTHDRKDIGGLIQTFIQTFKGTGNKPALILKTSSATYSVTDRNDMLNRIKSIRKQMNIAEHLMPNIYLLHGDLTPVELNDLYNHPKVKAMVSFTHGEGYGRPLQEFSVTGKPVFATNWSGHIDFLGNYTFKLPCRLAEVHESALQPGIFEKGAKWAYIDYGYASKTLKDCYKKYKNYLSTSRKQRKYIKDNFTLEHMTDNFKTLLDDNVKQNVPINIPQIKLPKLKKLEKVNG